MLLQGTNRSLFPRSSAVSECDNYTFSFPSQPSGDGRFSILSPLSLTSPYGFWWVLETGKESEVARDWRQRFILSCSIAAEAAASFEILSPLSRKRWYISTSEHHFLHQQMSCFQSLFHFFLLFCQVPSWDCQHYYNLWSRTAISWLISMHIYSGQATSRRSQGGRFLHYSNPVTTELKCFHYSFKPQGESRYDKLGSAYYYVLNQIDSKK